MRLALSKSLHFAHGIVAADFGDSENTVEFVGQRADSLDESGDVRMALVVGLELEVERAGALLVRRRGGRIVAQLRIVHRKVECIDAEAVHTSLEPEPHDIQHGLLRFAVVEVELRLAR